MTKDKTPYGETAPVASGGREECDGPSFFKGVRDAVKEYADEGHWRSCSGCHETEDGHDVGHYPFSRSFNTKLGGGCSECGGIGAIWDTTDYGALCDALSHPRPSDASVTGEGVREAAIVFVGLIEHDDVLEEADGYIKDAYRNLKSALRLALSPKPTGEG